MTDFFEPMNSEDHRALVLELTRRTKQERDMTAIELAQFNVLEALSRAEMAKAEVIYLRAMMP